MGQVRTACRSDLERARCNHDGVALVLAYFCVERCVV